MHEGVSDRYSVEMGYNYVYFDNGSNSCGRSKLSTGLLACDKGMSNCINNAMQNVLL